VRGMVTSREFEELARRVERRGHRLLLHASAARRDACGGIVEDGILTSLEVQTPGGALLARTFFGPGQTPAKAAATLLRRY
jgi:hypothetical protein